MKITENVALRSDGNVGEISRPVVMNTAGMTPVNINIWGED